MIGIKRAAIVSVAALAVASLSACQGISIPTKEAAMTYSATPVPSADAESLARNLLADAGVTAPPSANSFSVQLGSHPYLDGVFLVRFMAPREDTLSMSSVAPMAHFSLNYDEKDILGSITIPGDALSSELWNAAAQRTTRVFILPGDPAEVVILSYVHTR